jgi:hypothetical protein
VARVRAAIDPHDVTAVSVHWSFVFEIFKTMIAELFGGYFIHGCDAHTTPA